MNDFDAGEDKFLGLLLNFRGNINVLELHKSVQFTKKQSNGPKFFDWNPCPIKIGLDRI